MNKRAYFRKTPSHIKEGITSVWSGNFFIGSAISGIDNVSDFLSSFWINAIWETATYKPSSWRYGKKNVSDWEIIRRDLPKIHRTFYLGERPNFGDWSKGSHPVYQTRLVYPRDLVPARLFSARIESGDINGRTVVKLLILKEFNTLDIDEDELLFAVNLAYEEFWSVSVFKAWSELSDCIPSENFDWDFFPPGTRDEDLSKIYKGFGKLNDEEKAEIADRYDFLLQFKIIGFIRGNISNRYFWAKFADNLVAFENLSYGNAMYLLYDNWEELSKLSRLELLSKRSGEYERIVHSDGWKKKAAFFIRTKVAPTEVLS